MARETERALRLDRVRRRLDRWRQRRAHARSPIPAPIWTAAGGLVPRHGLYQTARALRLDYGTLKRHVESAPAAGPPWPPRLLHRVVGRRAAAQHSAPRLQHALLDSAVGAGAASGVTLGRLAASRRTGKVSTAIRSSSSRPSSIRRGFAAGAIARRTGSCSAARRAAATTRRPSSRPGCRGPIVRRSSATRRSSTLADALPPQPLGQRGAESGRRPLDPPPAGARLRSVTGHRAETAHRLAQDALRPPPGPSRAPHYASGPKRQPPTNL